jgi:hypothetical protein
MNFDVSDVYSHFVEQTQLYKPSDQILHFASKLYLRVPNNCNNKRWLFS